MRAGCLAVELEPSGAPSVSGEGEILG